MSAMVKKQIMESKNTATAEEIKIAVTDAFKSAFKDTGIATKDFTWFSNKPLLNK